MAKLLNKDPQLYEAERQRFLRELRLFHNNQRCDMRNADGGFSPFIWVFLSERAAGSTSVAAR